MKRWLQLVLLVGVVACPGEGGGPTAVPVPGFLSVTLTSPNGDDGGALFTVGGGTIDSVRAGGFRIRSARLSPTSFRVLVDGSLSSGSVILQIAVPDIGAASAYSGTLEQVASRASFANRPLPGYSLTVAP